MGNFAPLIADLRENDWKNVKKLLTKTIKAVIICNVAFYVNRKMGGR
jgi:hypothetical protein